MFYAEILLMGVFWRNISEHDLKDYEMDKINIHERNELTHKIIGCAMQVHRVLGNGFQEVIYQRALAIEMRHSGLEFEREKEMKIYYKDEEIGTRRVDFLLRQE